LRGSAFAGLTLTGGRTIGVPKSSAPISNSSTMASTRSA